jgi:peptidoglycan/xylan/chitin deacetylase (PgdA/CDA1 family)
MSGAPRVPLRQELKRQFASLYGRMRGPRRPGELTILNYHSVQPDEPFSTPADMFASQLEWLVERFELPTLDAWLEHAARGTSPPRPAALVTFDDGYENVHRFAYPSLKRLGVPSVLFVTTGFLDGGFGVEDRLAMYSRLPALSWEQLIELHRNGVTIGSHTHRHLNLGLATEAEVAEELQISKRLLEERLETEVRYFSYPWGQRRNIGRAAPRLVRESGYRAACSTLWGRNVAGTDPYMLRRVRIDPWDSIEDFAAKVNGAWDFIGAYHAWR